jgi:hypothetical protein
MYFWHRTAKSGIRFKKSWGGGKPSGHAIDTRRTGWGFHHWREISSLDPETLQTVCAYQVLWRENTCTRELPMVDTLAGMLIGAIAGYLIARHSAEIEWVLHALIG